MADISDDALIGSPMYRAYLDAWHAARGDEPCVEVLAALFLKSCVDAMADYGRCYSHATELVRSGEDPGMVRHKVMAWAEGTHDVDEVDWDQERFRPLFTALDDAIEGLSERSSPPAEWARLEALGRDLGGAQA